MGGAIPIPGAGGGLSATGGAAGPSAAGANTNNTLGGISPTLGNISFGAVNTGSGSNGVSLTTLLLIGGALAFLFFYGRRK